MFNFEDFNLHLLSYMSECDSAISESSVLLHWFRALKICLVSSLQGTLFLIFVLSYNESVVCFYYEKGLQQETYSL